MERLRPLLVSVAAFLLLITVRVVAQDSPCGACEQVEGKCSMPEGQKCERCKNLPQEEEEAPARPWLGVELRPVSPATRSQLDLPEGTGLEIARIVPGSPAGEAKLAQGDVIVAIGGEKVGGAEDLRRIMGGKKPGDVVKFGVIRKRKEMEISVKLGKFPEEVADAPKVVQVEGGKGPRFEKPPGEQRKRARRTPDQIREQAKKFLDAMNKREPGKKEGTAAEIGEFMDKMFGDEKKAKVEGEEEEGEEEEEGVEQEPFGGNLGELLRGLMGGEEGEEGKGRNPDLGKLLDGARKWMESEEGQRMMKTFGKMFGGEQEGEGEGESEGESPETGFDPDKIRELINQFFGGGEKEQGGGPKAERLREMFEGMFGTGEEEGEEASEGEGEEQQARPAQQQRPFDRVREMVKEFGARLKRLEQENEELPGVATKMFENFRREIAEQLEGQVAEIVKGNIGQMGRLMKDNFLAIQKELERQRGINEKLGQKVMELEKVIHELRKGAKPEVEIWRDFEPETGEGGIMVVKPVKPARPKKPETPKETAAPAERPWMGIVPGDADEDTRMEFDLPETGGTLIEEIVPGSPAEEAGLQPGDFVVVFAGKRIESAEHLRDLVAKQKIGAKVKVVVIREGERITKALKLGTVPRFSALPVVPAMNASVVPLQIPAWFGVPGGDPKPPRRGDRDKDKERQRKNQKKQVKREEPTDLDFLAEIEEGLDMLSSFGPGKKLYLAIQDEKGNTLFRHKIEPEKILKTLRSHIVPLLESVHENMRGGEGRSIMPAFGREFDIELPEPIVRMFQGENENEGECPVMEFMRDNLEYPGMREGRGEFGVCPKCGRECPHMKGKMGPGRNPQGEQPLCKHMMGQSGQPRMDQRAQGPCPFKQGKMRGIRQERRQPGMPGERIEKRILRFDQEVPGRKERGNNDHVMFLEGPVEGDVLFEFETPEDMPFPGKPQVRVQVLKEGPDEEMQGESRPGKCIKRMKVIRGPEFSEGAEPPRIELRLKAEEDEQPKQDRRKGQKKRRYESI